MITAGSEPKGQGVLPFSPVLDPSVPTSVCLMTSPPTCAAVPVSSLPWGLHGRHIYYLTLQLSGVQGTHTLVSSGPCEHLYGPPTAGLVVEVPQDTHENVVIELIKSIKE